MKRFRWLAAVGMSVLLAGCANLFPPCGTAGSVNMKEPKQKCYYLLTVTQLTPEVRGHVAESVVKANIARRPIHDNYKLEDYQFYDVGIQLTPDSDKTLLVVGQDFWFVSQPGSPLLKLTKDEDLPAHDENFSVAPKSSLAKQ